MGIESHPQPPQGLRAGTEERQETDRPPPPSALGTPSPSHQLLPGADTLLHPARQPWRANQGVLIRLCTAAAAASTPCQHPVPPQHPSTGIPAGRGPGWARGRGQGPRECSPAHPGWQMAPQQPRERVAVPVMSPWLLVSCTLSRKVTGPDNIIYIAV